MLLDWAIHASLIEKRLSLIVINQRAICVFKNFCGPGLLASVLQLIWYYSTSWVSNIGDLVLELSFWFRIINCRLFFMLGIITSNFLKIGNLFHSPSFSRCHDNDISVIMMTSSSKFCAISWRGQLKFWLRPWTLPNCPRNELFWSAIIIDNQLKGATRKITSNFKVCLHHHSSQERREIRG